jgi:UDPglucose 6-dehydrogenase
MNILVIGLGKLGLPLLALLADSNHKVYGMDKSRDLVESLKSQTFKSSEVGLMDLLAKNKSQISYVSSIEGILETIDLVFIIVPTPSEPSGKFSNHYVLEVVNDLGRSLEHRDSRIVINVVSTVMPGSCDGVITKAIEKSSGQQLGSNIGLCYSPEFIALGSVIKDMQYPDMHLLGTSHPWAGDVLEVALKSITKVSVPFLRMNLLEAELVKISVNNFVTMKISFANSLLQIAEYLGDIDIDKVTRAIGLDSRIGGRYMKAAAPYGGPCFPRDTRALTSLFKESGAIYSLSETTEKINEEYAKYIANKVISYVNQASTIGILGISYKSGTPVIDESPGIEIGKMLINSGFNVLLWDDEGPISSGLKAKNCRLDEILKEAEFFIIARNIEKVDYIVKSIRENGKKYLDLWRQ